MYVPGKVGEENMKGMSWFDMDLKNVQFEMKYNKKKKMPCKRNTTSLVMNDHRLVIVPCLRLVSASCKILLGPRLAIAHRNTRTTIANCNHNHTSKMKPTKPSLFAFGVATTTPVSVEGALES